MEDQHHRRGDEWSRINTIPRSRQSYSPLPVRPSLHTSLESGTTATPEQIAGWNIEIAPDGKNLPPGSGTIEMGKKVYDTQCLACHGAKLEGGIGPALAGGVGSLASDKPLKTVQSYWPYATTAFDYIRRAMPFQAPQSLTNDEVYAVTGYLLHEYGLIGADKVVNAEASGRSNAQQGRLL